MQNLNVQKCTKSDRMCAIFEAKYLHVVNSMKKMEQTFIEVVAFLLRLIKI